ncbi:MAG: hypothetical protein GDA43_07430 [Hormoscilla sp. SP5CHS1]|nr:hypothetical protein [Hormoscilla sp. SP5CHS1]
MESSIASGIFDRITISFVPRDWYVASGFNYSSHFLGPQKLLFHLYRSEGETSEIRAAIFTDSPEAVAAIKLSPNSNCLVPWLRLGTHRSQ